ncbi:MAG: 4Fe-4S dicluster domain-containing protein [Acidimicrobiia bacterium]|nr:4Fe-4S dicluster domain-containing protein [Acidimicrobiia bacterium]
MTQDARELWRSLDELADDPAFRERLHREFPTPVEAVTDPLERRSFLKLMGASLGLAGVTACTKQPVEKIVPYVRQPEEVVPGKPLFFATAMPLGGAGVGVLVESHEGRPTKVEGNPTHPDSLGATDVFAQAAVLDLYDPDRARVVTNVGEIRPWPTFLATLRAALAGQQRLRGAGLRILTESISSPTLSAQLQGILTQYPEAKWHQWDPAGRDTAYSGARLAFGEPVETLYQIDRADVIVALDADFLTCGPGSLRYARQFAGRRRPSEAERMNRLYVAEAMPTSTGARADHRLPVKPSEVDLIARQLAVAVGVAGVPTGGSFAGTAAEHVSRWIAAVAKDLQGHKGASVVIAGPSQPASVHALAHAMNAALGSVGTTVVYTEPVVTSPVDHSESIKDLVADMTAGRVDILLMMGGNPVYSSPADLTFGAAMAKVPLRIYYGSHDDETAGQSHWHVPQSHFLESWSDVRALDGTVSIIQPLIAPLYATRSPHELLAVFSDTPEKSGYEIVREHWIKTTGLGRPDDESDATPEFESRWRRWLHDGVMEGTAFAPRAVTLRADATAAAAALSGSGADIQFRTDPCVLDGRFANNGWLQELPKPLTKLVWDNAVIVSPTMAQQIGVETSFSYQGGERGQTLSEIVEVRYNGRSVRGALFPVVGHPDAVVTVHLGYGRRRGGSLLRGAGFDANAIRTSDALYVGRGVEITRTGDGYSLACTQGHHSMQGRGMVRALTKEEFLRHPEAVHEGFESPPRTLTLVPEYKYEGYKWGMAIDVNVCTGCNACVIGCQAENNIPVVGKAQVLRGREMHWLRVDQYHRGAPENPETFFQPVPCQQCENAPCEVVCPVNATVHSHEGLNDQVYNRCVGTRYCSNNCPYKVRRFNYLLYQDWDTPSLKLGRNPDVTVRSRGVMEKCTYCVQRINEAKITSEKERRKVRDGEIQTACEAACPTEAIVFGDLNDPQSRVSRLQAEQRNYAMLADLNTRPRTTYLAVVRNANPEVGA